MTLSHQSLISMIACLDSARRRSLRAARLAAVAGDAWATTAHATTADHCLADMAALRKSLHSAP